MLVPNIELLRNSSIRAGIGQNLGAIDNQAGDITLDAAGTILISENSSIRNDVFNGGVGSSGNILISTSGTFKLKSSFVQNGVLERGIGKNGKLAINALNIDISDNSDINSGTASRLNSLNSQGQDIILNAAGEITVSGNSSVQNSVFNGGIGNSGNIFFNVGTNLKVTNSLVQSLVSRQGIGNNGRITINARNIDISENSDINTGTQSNLNSLDNKLQDLVLDATEFISVSGGSSVRSSVFSDGVGNGGNLYITTRNLIVKNSQIGTSTFGIGSSGDLIVSATESIMLSGELPSGVAPGGLFAQVNVSSTGRGGRLSIQTQRLSVSDGSKVQVATFGDGDAGDLFIRAEEIDVFETSIPNSFSTEINAGVTLDPRNVRPPKGNGGNLTIETGRLSIRDGGEVTVSTLGEGSSGDLVVRARDLIEVVGTSVEEGSFNQASSLDAIVGRRGVGPGGNLTIETRRLSVRGGGQVSVSTLGQGNAGNLSIRVTDSTEVVGVSSDNLFSSEISAAVEPTGTGIGGNLDLTTGRLSLRDGGIITSRSLGQRSAGDVTITVRGEFQANNGTISTASLAGGGGDITVTAGNIFLDGNSDIRTNTANGDGGNITLKANSIIALDDSDILAFAQQGRGGNITLDTPVFFGQNYRPAPLGTNPLTLEGNNRVDVNASGTVSGIISLPDQSFLQQNLSQLPQSLIDTNRLLANSCIVRDAAAGGTFIVTGTGGLPVRPGDAPLPAFPTGDVQGVAADGRTDETDRGRTASASSVSNPLPEAIAEAQGIYKLPDGQIILSWECSR